MGRPVKNLIGQTFNQLTVIKRGPNDKGLNAQWWCKCSCGKNVLVRGFNLKSGGTISCGCSKLLLNLTGQKFGRLTVIKRGRDDKVGHVQWWCTCDCKNLSILTASYSLTKGFTKSCGCYSRESSRTRIKALNETGIYKQKPVDLTDETFGRLTVIKQGPNTNSNEVRWWCACNCGKMSVLIRAVSLCCGHTKSCGCLQKEMASKRFYIDGRTPESLRQRRLFHDSGLREQCFERDNYTCQICGKRNGTHNADHIKSWSAYPELRFVLSNLRTLCVECHKKTPTYGRHNHKIKEVKA